MKAPWRILCLLLLGCSGGGEEEELRLLGFPQAGREDIFLNEPLVFKFNAKVDPSSVTSHSIVISTPRGAMARGRFQMDAGGKWVKFLPLVALDPSLKDGGFLPGEEYRVQVIGFPRPNGIRSYSGRILTRGVRSKFRVVDPGNLPEGRPTPFLDEDIAIPGPFLDRNSPGEVYPDEPIILQFAKPLRPDRVVEENFRVFEDREDPEGRGIPIQVRLLENVGVAKVEITLLSKVDPARNYFLTIQDGVTDFGGNRVPYSSHLATSRTFPIQFIAREE